jgi:aryl-alcohol dehydrogenase-like predicted oxidoreductase
LKLALGTVQFGLNYGISNQGGQVSREDAKGILALARLHGIDTLDTAIGYGESESCLGDVGVAGFKVITKKPS